MLHYFLFKISCIIVKTYYIGAMMSELEKDKEKDFFERTLYNLELYNNEYKKKQKIYKYEVTMLLNSLLGLIIIPKEKTSLLNKVDISFLDYSGSTKDFFRHMRNSISHGHFIDNIQVDKSTKEIEKVTFIDKCPNCQNETFNKTLTVSQLSQLIDEIGKIMKKNKN